MTQGTFEKTIESAEYEFVLIKGLEEENARLKAAINDVLDVLVDDSGVPNTIWIKDRLLKEVSK